jgi:hypothetical protein
MDLVKIASQADVEIALGRWETLGDLVMRGNVRRIVGTLSFALCLPVMAADAAPVTEADGYLVPGVATRLIEESGRGIPDGPFSRSYVFFFTSALNQECPGLLGAQVGIEDIYLTTSYVTGGLTVTFDSTFDFSDEAISKSLGAAADLAPVATAGKYDAQRLAGHFGCESEEVRTALAFGMNIMSTRGTWRLENSDVHRLVPRMSTVLVALLDAAGVLMRHDGKGELISIDGFEVLRNDWALQFLDPTDDYVPSFAPWAYGPATIYLYKQSLGALSFVETKRITTPEDFYSYQDAEERIIQEDVDILRSSDVLTVYCAYKGNLAYRGGGGRMFWLGKVPPEAAPERLRSRMENHPFLAYHPAVDQCPATIEEAERL